jgi:hypothetical protein
MALSNYARPGVRCGQGPTWRAPRPWLRSDFRLTFTQLGLLPENVRITFELLDHTYVLTDFDPSAEVSSLVLNTHRGFGRIRWNWSIALDTTWVPSTGQLLVGSLQTPDAWLDGVKMAVFWLHSSSLRRPDKKVIFLLFYKVILQSYF